MFRIATLALALTVAATAPALASRAREAAREAENKHVETLNAAVTAYNAKNYPEAIASATAALGMRLTPEQAGNMYLIRGMSHAQTKNCAAAIPDFDQAIDALPDDVGALQGRSFCRGLAGDSAGALADVEAALKLTPNDPALVRSQCVLATNSQAWNVAAPACSAAHAAAPDDKDMHMAMAQALEQTGDKARAHAAWTSLAAKDPSNPNAAAGVARTK